MARLLTIVIFSLLAFFTASSQQTARTFDQKSTIALKQRIQVAGTDSLDVYISFAESLLPSGPFRTLRLYDKARVGLIRIPSTQVQKFVEQKQVLFADIYVAPKEELTTGTLDLATNQANLAQNAFPNITGDGILVSVKENKLDTTDLDYKGRYVNTGQANTTITNHASLMATTIAGAGNTSTFAKGLAPAGLVTSSSFTILLPDPDAVIQQYGISVQNHSYGTVLQNYYGPEAVAYDVSATANPTLLHVFSSGNAGLQNGTGIYNGIPGYSNLTGNFKMSKNTIAVGAIDSFYNIAIASSKGPAYDGRIKPELVAFGEDGSSGAAAMVSGAAALVQQAYRLRMGKLPASAITKAVLLNSATDVGATGIDFSSGYGNLNVYQAVKAVQDNRIFESAITAHQTKTFQLVVPQNAAKLKVLLAWTDPAAGANATKALINDLNLSVKAPDNSTWLPWVLNPKDDINALRSLPERKVDTLNPVEQVTIDAPIAGTYMISVMFGALATADQPFSIVYQVDTVESFGWTFPTASDKLQAAVANVVRWQTNKTGSGELEYSIDKQNWKPIVSLPDISIGYYKWMTPDTTTTAWLRLKAGATAIVSDTFVISSLPQMNTAFQCADSFLLYWDRQRDAQYQLYELNDQYLEPFLLTADSFALLKKGQHPSIYYSIAPVVNGKPGLHSALFNYAAQGVGCYFRSFYLQTQTATSVTLFSSLGSTFGVKNLALQKLNGNSFQTLYTINDPSVTDFTFDDKALHRGLNQYRLQLQLANGQILYGEVIKVYHFDNTDVILYPNPVRQNSPVHILASKAGRTTIEVYNGNGLLIKTMRLKDLHQEIPPLRLSTGIYLIKVIDEETSNVSSQKLIVY